MKCQRVGCLNEVMTHTRRPALYCSNACRQAAARDRAKLREAARLKNGLYELTARAKYVVSAYNRYNQTKALAAFHALELRILDLAECKLLSDHARAPAQSESTQARAGGCIGAGVPSGAGNVD